MTAQPLESRVEIEVSAPSSKPGSVIVGTLTTPSEPSYPPSVVVLAHGFAGHRDYCYHKLLAKKLSDELGLYCFRFDFRDCGESAEIETADKRILEEDYSDIADVLSYLRNQQNLFVSTLVGHSRGAVATLTYAALHDREIPYLVNVSGRYTSIEIRDRVSQLAESWEADNGYYANVPRNRETKRRWFPAAETHSLAKPDMSICANCSSDFLTIYGLADTIVSVSDSAKFANLLAGRHTLRLVPDADHNFYGISSEPGQRGTNYNPQVADLVVSFLDPEARRLRFVQRSQLLTGTRHHRWKSVDGVPNWRDLGGWPTRDLSSFVREGFIFRAASLSTISSEGAIDVNRKLGIKKSFDLRSTIECAKSGVYEVPGLQRVHCPLGGDEDMSPAEIAMKLSKLDVSDLEGYIIVYKDFLEQGARPYKYIFEHIRDYPNHPIVMHCTGRYLTFV